MAARGAAGSSRSLELAHDACDSAPMSQACNRCGAAIVFALDGKRHRVAVEAHASGPLVLFPAPPGSADPQLREVPIDGALQIRTLRYRRHSESCPARGKRRKGRG